MKLSLAILNKNKCLFFELIIGLVSCDDHGAKGVGTGSKIPQSHGTFSIVMG